MSYDNALSVLATIEENIDFLKKTTDHIDDYNQLQT